MKKGTAKHHKELPIHTACVTGNKGALKNIVSTLPKRGLEIKDCLGRTPLILTVSKNHIDCCAVLLKAGATVDNTDNAGQTALHIAANKGLHHFVKLLLQYKASWIQRDYFGATALHMAAVHPNVKGLSLVMKYVKPAEIDVQDSTLRTALHWAAAYICNNNIKLLLSQGANACIPDEGGKTPLHWAVANSNPEALACVKTLLKNEPSLINWQDYDGRSPLHIAVTNGSEEIVYYLTSVEHCNADITDNCFLTPLHYAAKRGHAEKADILLKKRASPLSIDDYGAMPLHYAAYHNHVETVGVFTNKNYVYDEPDNFGRSALMWAVLSDSVDVLKILISAYGTSYADRKGFTALHAAAINGNDAVVKLLINEGFYVDSKDKNGMTPFLKACEFGRSKAAQALLDLSANINEKDYNSSSALHWCATGGHAYLTDILIKRGADYNARDNLRMTPLHYVSLYGDFVNCTCVLVESGANVNLVDIEGKMPLHCAVLHERYGIANYLCESGADVNAMFLMNNDWFTPYDCAMFRCDVKIAIMIEKYGGVQCDAIRECAMRVIKCWYREKKRSISKDVQQNFVPASLCQICCLMDKNKDFFFICNKCFYKYAQFSVSKKDSLKLQKETADCCKFSNISISGYVTGYRLLAFCKNPSTCNINSIGLIKLDNVVYKQSFFHVLLERTATEPFYNILRNTAARIVQKAWKRYKLKKNFSKARNEVHLSCTTCCERLVLESVWHLELEAFLQNFSE